MDQYYSQYYGGRIPYANQSDMDRNALTGIDLDGYGDPGMYGGRMNRQSQHDGIKQEGNQNGDMSSDRDQVMDDMQHNQNTFSFNDASSQNVEYVPASNNYPGMMMNQDHVFGNNAMNNVGGQQGQQPLNIVTQYTSPTTMTSMASPISAYQSPHPHSAHPSMGMGSGFMPQNMQMSMDYTDPNMSGLMSNNNHQTNFNHFAQNQFNQQYMVSPMSTDFAGAGQNMHNQDGPRNQSMKDRRQSYAPDGNQIHNQNDQQLLQRRNSVPINLMSNHTSGSTQHSSSGHSPMTPVQQDSSYTSSNQTQPQLQKSSAENVYHWPSTDHGMPTNVVLRQHPAASYTNAYSSTGFDMMTVLMRVATRKNPEINIGAVDLSCAFVVCDVTEHDIPIVYCSENFERLTGYTKHEILGRNCRFLQAPDGKVQAGFKRSYVDDDSVLYLKNMINARKEAQVSLINYRKGGQPFMNLLTMIPIPYDTDEIKFIVGFQVDLVEQPNSVTNKNPDGSYTINYQRGLTMPRYVFTGGERQLPTIESGQTVSRDDVTTVLNTMGSGESEFSKRLWDKVLLENTDDVVFVLSLKGLFLYLSPSSSKILEYDPTELTGTALSSVCHPSDIVPVTRELKDTSSSSDVDVVFRIRRKKSGYMWFEGHGSLHTEQGKGRKSIVLVGRERPVYTLSKTEIFANGGIVDNEVWTKLSTSGMFLFVSSNIRSLLDKQPDELIGTSMQALMRPESRNDFLRILELARTGKRASAKHELLNKRGQILQAQSTIYPGDAVEGQKPTFIIAQTRLLKLNRPGTNQRTVSLTKADSQNSVPTLGTPASGAGATANSVAPSPQRFMSSFESATTYAGQHGLEIGRQDLALASDENLFDELKTTRSTSWQFELRQMEKRNRLLAEELQSLLAARKKRKRRKGPAGTGGQAEKDCANCHTRVTPEWRRGPSGNRDLCNSCGLRYAKQQGRISPRTNSHRSAQSAGSDGKGSAGSPKTGQHVGREVSPIGSNETGNDKTSSIDATAIDSNKRGKSPPDSQQNSNGGETMINPHSPKVAKMDTTMLDNTSPKRFSGGGSGVPAKIEEEP